MGNGKNKSGKTKINEKISSKFLEIIEKFDMEFINSMENEAN